MKRVCMLAVLLLVIGASSYGFDTTPLQISLWPSRVQVVPTEIDVSGLKLNLPYGGNNKITGIDIGIASKSNNTSAFQVNLFNCAVENYAGLEVGLLNLSGESSGIQIGVLLNETDGLAKGLQVGLINSTREMSGVQIGLINYTEFMTGVQIGLVNIITESYVPFFPIINFCFD